MIYQDWEISVTERYQSCVHASVNCQNQDLRDFMIYQDWEISITERTNPDNPQILKILILTVLCRQTGYANVVS